jgi:type I restriction enzyme, S subunit
MTAFPKYDRYKDSGVEWLGEVPEHWEVAPFQGLFDMSPEKNGNEIVGEMLSISGYRGVEQKRYESDSQKRTKEQLAYYRVVRQGQLAVNTMWLNYAGLGVSDLEGYMSPAYRAYYIRPRLSGRYAHHLLRSSIYVEAYTGLMQDIRPNSMQIKNEDFKKIPVLVPPIPEQDRIVAFLDQKTAEIDALIAKKQRQIELLDEQKAILINRAVTRGLNPNAKLKPSGIEWIGDIPEHWEVVPLKRNANVQTGLTLGKDYPPGRSVEVPYLRVANVQNGHLALGSVTTLRVPKSLVPRYALQEGDVLVAEGGDLDKLGRGCVWRSEIETCMHQNHVFAVRPYPAKILPEFLSLALSCKYGQRYFMLTGKQTTNLASTNSTALMNFPVALPLIEEQVEILKALDEIKIGFQNLIRLIDSETQSLKTLRSTLISHAVTGRIKV